MSQESEQAQEAWRKHYEEFFGDPSDNYEPDKWGRDLAALMGQAELRAALKAEIEYEINKLEDTEKHGGLTAYGKGKLEHCRWFLSLLDTVKPR